MKNSKYNFEYHLLNVIMEKLAPLRCIPGTKAVQPNFISASVLIPIVRKQGVYSILFTKRTEFVNNHKGQISFPGGLIEKEDKDPLSAAIREAEEELGILKSDIQVLGQMDPFKTISGYYIHSFIGFKNDLSDININQAEVDKLLLVPMEWLEDNNNFREELYKRKGYEAHPVFIYSDYEGEVVWGITASILQKFLNKIKK